LVAKSLLWDMEDIYGATKANIHGWLATLSWMVLFKSLIVGVICNKCIIIFNVHTFHGMEGFVLAFGKATYGW
jgi:hypothetical protein